MTRLVYLSASTIPSTAANSVQVMKACEAFGQVGIDTVLYAERPDRSDPFAAYGCTPSFRLEAYPDRTALPLPYGLGRRLADHLFARTIRRLAPNILYGRSLRRLARVLAHGVTARQAVGIELHTLPLDVTAQDLFADLLRIAPGLRVVVISTALRDQLLERTPGLPEDSILVTHNGADLRLAEGSARSLGPGFHLGYVGGLYPGCGLDIVAAAIAGLDGVTLNVVGGTGEEIERWRRVLPNQGKIVWHGRVPPAEVGGFLRAFDAVVAPYTPEAEGHGGVLKAGWMSPMKIFEAMAAARPILATDLPVVREILDDGVTGLLLPPDDPAAWREATLTLRNDPAQAWRLGIAARQRCEACHSWSARARRILDFLAADVS